MAALKDPNTSDLASQAEFDALLANNWQLAHRLSNPVLDNDTFSVDEEVANGVITYRLYLNEFLGIENKKVTLGKGFSKSPTTKNIYLDESDPYAITFDARSSEDMEDWSTETLNLRPYLKMKHGVLFGGDAAPVMVIKLPEGEGESTDASTQTTYEMSAGQAKALVDYDEAEEALMKGDGDSQQKAYEPHPDHKPVAQEEQEEGQFVTNGLFGDGAKLGKLINVIINGSPHPGKMKYRKDAKGHEYFGCEKHEHDFKNRTWKNVCT